MSSFFSAAANALLGAVAAAGDLAKDWGPNINWVNFKDGMRLSKETGKPAMIVIHKSWCRACKALKPKFAKDKEIEAMSNHFIMINVEDDDEPRSVEYRPDGSYIPRILFLNGDGKVMTQVINENSDFKYYYPGTDQIVDNMKNVLKMTGSSTGKPMNMSNTRDRSDSLTRNHRGRH